MNRPRPRRGLLTCAAIGLVVAPLGLSAQAACAFPGSAQDRSWPEPLDRVVTMRSNTVPLRDAIDALVSGTGLRITYSSDLLPARSVCASLTSQRVGAVLSTWLSGTTLEPVAVSAQLIVLAPARGQAGAARPEPREFPAQPLDVVSVQGSADRGVDVRRDVYARDVIHRTALQNTPGATLGQILSVAVPGLWAWSPSGQGLQTSGVSLRGASSFGVTSPKVYIDGIEVANPLIASQLNADAIEEIEVIRGPQGAALYGSDAINGVINITTRHDGASRGEHEFLLTSNAGVSSSDYSSAGVLQRDHGLSYRVGSGGNTLGLGLAMNSTGAFVPGQASERVLGNAGVSLLRGHTLMQFTARGYSHRSGVAPNPVFQNLQSLGGAGSSAPATGASVQLSGQSVSEYTLGTQIRSGTGAWTHSFVAGIDGYRLENATLPGMPVRTPADSAVQAASGASDRVTLRLSTNGRLVRPNGTGPVVRITLGVEQSVLRDATFASTGETNATVTAWRNTTGALANGDVSLGKGFSLAGGVRLEHNNGYTSFDDISVLPTIGSAWFHEFGPTQLTLRGAYGRAIRPPRVSAVVLSGPAQWDDLGPEQQSGVEFGADLVVASRFMLRATVFDQIASGLVQPVLSPRFGGATSALYDLQNVGAIENKGVELQGSADMGRLRLNAGLSVVDSRVIRVAAGYRGDMREGDRALQVPRQTLGLGAQWTASQWGATVGVNRAADWVNYDWLAIAESDAVHGSGISRQPAKLRNFRKDYAGVTRVRASFSRNLTRGISLLLFGDNLLGTQRGEPDNVTIVPGRLFSAGFRAGF